MHHSDHGLAGVVLQPGQPVGEQADVAAKLVDEQALDRGPFRVVQQLQRAYQGREHAAPVDVAAQQHRRVGVQRDPHVDDLRGL